MLAYQDMYGAPGDELEERVGLFANIASQETSYKLILHMIYPRSSLRSASTVIKMTILSYE
jgi:hypothetical protein